MLKTLSDNMKAQTGKEPDEEQLKTLRDQAWQAMVTQNIVEAQIKKLGLTVTDQELIDWVRGPILRKTSVGILSIRPAPSAGMFSTNFSRIRTNFSAILRSRPELRRRVARKIRNAISASAG